MKRSLADQKKTTGRSSGEAGKEGESVEPILPVPIPHTQAHFARGIRAGRWLFATGLSGTDYVNGMAPDVVQAKHPLNGVARAKRESRRLFRTWKKFWRRQGRVFPTCFASTSIIPTPTRSLRHFTPPGSRTN